MIGESQDNQLLLCRNWSTEFQKKQLVILFKKPTSSRFSQVFTREQLYFEKKKCIDRGCFTTLIIFKKVQQLKVSIKIPLIIFLGDWEKLKQLISEKLWQQNAKL